MSKILIVLLFAIGCSSKPVEKETTKTQTTPPKEFSRGEVILATTLLTKIFDGEMAPLTCVPDKEEAELLLRTIRPRMELVQDDLEALLDDPKEVAALVNSCDQNCTCGFIEELLREHLVNLTKTQRQALNKKKSDKEINRCMNYVQTTFCQSELYRTLDKEKVDFTFEEGT